MVKRCIFHYPSPIEDNPSSGSAVRPKKMIEAFKENGYLVEEVTGYGKERKRKIDEIKKKIRDGIKFDFMYSECTTMPTLLTEKNHIPRHPLLDFSFFKFCRKNDIKIGLFYRDMYWKFPIYKETTSKWIPYITIPFYKYDLRKYKKLVNKLYVASTDVMQYLEGKWDFKPLPPGGMQYSGIAQKHIKKPEGKALTLVYVGGVSGLNDLTGFLSPLTKHQAIKLILCCRQDDWQHNKHRYGEILTDRIEVVHASGSALEPYYEEADIACAYFENNVYRDMAMPIKLFEYIGFGKPIIATSNTAAGNFIEKEDIGWVVSYGEEHLNELLEHLLRNKGEIIEKRKNVLNIIEKNSWKSRAKTVSEDLR